MLVSQSTHYALQTAFGFAFHLTVFCEPVKNQGEAIIHGISGSLRVIMGKYAEIQVARSWIGHL